MCSFYLESSMGLVKKLTHDIECETSSVNEAHNHSAMPTSQTLFKRCKN